MINHFRTESISKNKELYVHFLPLCRTEITRVAEILLMNDKPSFLYLWPREMG